MAIDVRVLGPVELYEGDKAIDLGPPRQRAVLAILAAETNQPVAAARLLRLLWPQDPPRQARKTLHSYLTRLRGVLSGIDGIDIVRDTAGYRLAVASQAVDLERFRSHVAQAQTSRDDRAAAEHWQAALRQWRGHAFADMDLPFLDGIRRGLDAERYAAELERNAVGLRLGEYGELLPELVARFAEQQFDERLAGQLMEALFKSGRTADAAECYRGLRQRMAEELGQEPSTTLRELHRRILSDDQAVAGGTTPPWQTKQEVPTPRLLPAMPRGFSGRHHDIARLDAEPGGISVISGPGGVGKTWLAVHWSHHNSPRFGDGQLYVNLRGFDPATEPLPPAEALAQFLEALGVNESAQPRSTESRANLFRSLVADREMLIVLDNARDAAQVDPLLPGTASCFTIITSRHQLQALSARYGAQAQRLESMRRQDAWQLLADQLGPDRLDNDPKSAVELIELCDGLPLAISLVATHLDSQPNTDLASLCAELRDDSARLDLLSTPGLSVGMRAIMAGSYRALSPHAREVFDMAGISFASQWDSHALASITGYSPRTIRPLVTELERAHLLEQYIPGRYRMHDLTRLYAQERSAETVDETVAREVLWRNVEYYLRAADLYVELTRPAKQPTNLGPPPAEVVIDTEKTVAAARTWLSAELTNLMEAQEIAARHRWPAAFDLAVVSLTALLGRGQCTRMLTVGQLALDAADDLDRDEDTAYVCAMLIIAHVYLGKLSEATALRDKARAHISRAGDMATKGVVDMVVGFLAHALGDYREELECNLRALRVFQRHGPHVRVAARLNGVGWAYARLGQYAEAEEYCRRSVAAMEELGDHVGKASALDSLGFIAHQRGEFGVAIQWYGQAQECMRQAQHADRDGVPPSGYAEILEHLGDSYRALGYVDLAVDSWRHARAIDGFYQRAERVAGLETKLAEVPEQVAS